MQNIINMPGYILTNTGTINVSGNQRIYAASFESSGVQNYRIYNASTFDSIVADCLVDIRNGTVNIASNFLAPAGSSGLGTWSKQIVGGNILRVAYVRDSVGKNCGRNIGL